MVKQLLISTKRGPYGLVTKML